MEQRIQLVHREHQEGKGKWDNLFTVNEAEKTKRFHVSIPGYQPTVLENLGNLANELGLDENSRVLCISTEGATDRENYRKIVWDGLCSSANL